MSEATDTAESDCGSWFSQADQQRSCCRRVCQERCYANTAQEDSADAVSEDYKGHADVLRMLFSVRIQEAADTAEIGCCSVCSCMQTNKGRAAEELAKTAAATAQRRAAEELAKSAATLGLPAQADQQRSCCCRGVCRDRCCRSDVPGARI